MNLVNVSSYLFYDKHKIILENGYVEPPTEKTERFLAIGIEKSKPSDNWEYSDVLNVVVLVKGNDQQYYMTKIEHYPENILTPRYAEDDRFVHFVEELEFAENRLISDIYVSDDPRWQYTITIVDGDNNEKAYQIYEKYIRYKISVAYETYDYEPDMTEASCFFWVRCQVGRIMPMDSSEDLENKIIQYRIWLWKLLETSVFKVPYFEKYKGTVTTDGVEVVIE